MTGDLSAVSTEALQDELARRNGTACHECGRVADYLCDGLVLTPFGTFREERCDRKLCDDCRHEASRVFFCGKDGGIESRDWCPECRTGGGRRALTEAPDAP